MAYDTSILDQALSQRQARWEAQRQETLARLYQWLDETAGQFQVQQIYIFGSLIQANTFTDHSDIDVAVIDIPHEHFFKLAAALAAALGREVDLIELDQCHFADKIRREGLLWTVSD
jgi:predicted nucleotidyltransferase